MLLTVHGTEAQCKSNGGEERLEGHCVEKKDTEEK